MVARSARLGSHQRRLRRLEIRPPRIAFQPPVRVGPREKTTKNRLHLDFRPDDRDAEVQRLLALGAASRRGTGRAVVGGPRRPRRQRVLRTWVTFHSRRLGHNVPRTAPQVAATGGAACGRSTSSCMARRRDGRLIFDSVTHPGCDEWTSAHVDAVLGEVISPLAWTVVGPAFERSQARLWAALGVVPPARDRQVPVQCPAERPASHRSGDSADRCCPSPVWTRRERSASWGSRRRRGRRPGTTGRGIGRRPRRRRRRCGRLCGFDVNGAWCGRARRARHPRCRSGAPKSWPSRSRVCVVSWCRCCKHMSSCGWPPTPRLTACALIARTTTWNVRSTG